MQWKDRNVVNSLTKFANVGFELESKEADFSTEGVVIEDLKYHELPTLAPTV
jgi:hypothetical protein